MMSKSFAERLFPRLPAIAEHFGTPFHIYDEDGIRETCARIKEAFEPVNRLSGFKEYYAVKALPNPDILAIMPEFSFGFDCSSTIELELSREAGGSGEDMMFTSNDTTKQEFNAALDEGAIINLDDVSLFPKLQRIPDLICFRYNPGKGRTGNSIIGTPFEAKYGIMDSQLIVAYSHAKQMGVRRFGIHTMVCSNQRNYRYMVETVRMLLALCKRLHRKLAIKCEFMNMGGGIGIPYRPQHHHVDIELMANEIFRLMRDFKKANGWVPALFMESGRFVTGPHGVLVNRVINRKDTYQTHVGVEVAMPALMRHAIYGAYHHATILDKNGKLCDDRRKEIANIVGPICENCDRLATQRLLPIAKIGDFVVTHDTGAHGIAMGFNYNGRTRPQELMIEPGGDVRRIRRAETNDDLRHTLRGFSRKRVRFD